MANMTTKLTCKAELWGRTKAENELEEEEYVDGKIKDVYCNILPSNYSIKSTPVTEKTEHTHKFMVRAKSILNPQLGMFFMHKDIKYNFVSWDFDFASKEFFNVFTKQVIE